MSDCPAREQLVFLLAEQLHGPDAEWVMGLAFGDARGELTAELDKAQARAPRSPRIREARELSGR